MSKKKKIVLVLVGVVALVIAGLMAVVLQSGEDKPTGVAGPMADELSMAMLKAANTEAWNKTTAVTWNFGGRQQHLWDRERSFARVRWNKGTMEALVDLRSKTGLVTRNGELVPGGEGKILVDEAWAHWVNDSFWLNPIPKAFDPGVTREIVTLEDGKKGLMLSYKGEGGVTPGDTYLWILDDKNQPTSWKMWVSIIPIGGIEASWDEWTSLSTGAKISTSHKMGPITIELTDLKGGTSLAAVEPGEDPFKPLVEARKKAPEAAPTSKPGK